MINNFLKRKINFLLGKTNLVDFSKKQILNNLKNNWVITQIKDIEKSENKSGKLFNIPYSLKDNIITKNIKTTAGSKILNNYYPSYNSTIYKILKNAGAILMAKTSLDELGQGGTGNNFYYGNAKNPYDEKRISGGSSSGSAAQVAAGDVVFAIGSDTGDSIRIPAAYCGVVGFKPSWGRISRFGLIPYSPSLDTIGIITNYVEDNIVIYNLLNGRDENDLTTINEKNHSILLKKTIKKSIKILIWKNIFNKIKDKDYLNSFNKLITELKNNPLFFVEEKNIDPLIIESLCFVYKQIANSESISSCSNLTGLLFGNAIKGESWKEIFTLSRTNNLSFAVRKRFFLGLFATHKDNQIKILKKVRKFRTLIIETMNKIFSQYDVILNPIAGTIAPLMKDIHEKVEYSNKTNYLIDHLLISNLIGGPSISLPLSKINNIPIGISLMTQFKNDEDCLNIAFQVEKIITNINHEK